MKYFLIVSILVSAGALAETLRTKEGKPDFSGFYNTAQLTPLQRDSDFGDKKFMTREEAEEVTKLMRGLLATGDEKSDPDRDAPEVGGDGNNGLGAGNVGGYNSFWVDPGDDVYEIDGKLRTSIIYDPPNGRQPLPTVSGGLKLLKISASFRHDNDGSASWLASRGEGPFDGPETLALSERCLLGFDGAAPALPSLYNNFKRIVQTEDHVMILFEMVHDARIIKIGGRHVNDAIRDWQGDSIGWWDGDTLVAETKNFTEFNGLYGADKNLKVTERFTLLEDGDILYDFTVDDPTAWQEPWSGEYLWRASEDKVYEYACHEGNYAMGNILRGARMLEDEYTGRIPDSNEGWYLGLENR